jgi:hypothetical protein
MVGEDTGLYELAVTAVSRISHRPRSNLKDIAKAVLGGVGFRHA